MQIDFYTRSIYVVAKVSGDLDLSSASRFRDTIDQMLEKSAVPHLIVNLKNLSFIDSTGLGVLLGRHKGVTSWGGQFILVDVPPKIMSMFEMAGLTPLFKTKRTEQDAVIYLNSCQYGTDEEATFNE